MRASALLVVLVVVACGGSSGPGSSSAANGSSSAGEPTSEAASESAGPTTTSGSDAGPSTSGVDGGPDASGTAADDETTTGASTDVCTRELLGSTLEAYFTALAAHDPTSLPLADTVRFTENGVEQTLGEGLWQTAGARRYAHSALDVDTCTVVSQAVVTEGDLDIPFGLRLALVAGRITEIESIAVRPGDYTVNGQPFPSDTQALADSANTVHWDDPVPAGQNTREELVAWIDKYYRQFPNGVCNTVDDCIRIENGGGSFRCSLGAGCSAEAPNPNEAVLEPRLLLADVERGLGVGFTMFQGHTDVHVFKMHGGQVYGVSAILGAADSSGWE